MVFIRNFLVLAASLAASNFISSVLGVTFVIRNQCPLPATYYINADNLGPLAAWGGEAVKEFADDFTGSIFTDTNGGDQHAVGTTRAWFFIPSDYYYILVDRDHLNIGMTITPNVSPDDGWCTEASCTAPGCGDAFVTQPMQLPDQSDTAPHPPLHSCCEATAYTITFCPNFDFPQGVGPVTLHPNGNPDKCLDVQGAIYANGTPVQIYDCNGTAAQKWRVNVEQTKVRLEGTNFCLDAGSAPANGVGLKIWECYDNIPAQDFWYNYDGQLWLNGGQNQCVDLTGGQVTNGNLVQTWECSPNNANQIWTAV